MNTCHSQSWGQHSPNPKQCPPSTRTGKSEKSSSPSEATRVSTEKGHSDVSGKAQVETTKKRTSFTKTISEEELCRDVAATVSEDGVQESKYELQEDAQRKSSEDQLPRWCSCCLDPSPAQNTRVRPKQLREIILTMVQNTHPSNEPVKHQRAKKDPTDRATPANVSPTSSRNFRPDFDVISIPDKDPILQKASRPPPPQVVLEGAGWQELIVSPVKMLYEDYSKPVPVAGDSTDSTSSSSEGCPCPEQADTGFNHEATAIEECSAPVSYWRQHAEEGARILKHAEHRPELEDEAGHKIVSNTDLLDSQDHQKVSSRREDLDPLREKDVKQGGGEGVAMTGETWAGYSHLVDLAVRCYDVMDPLLLGRLLCNADVGDILFRPSTFEALCQQLENHLRNLEDFQQFLQLLISQRTPDRAPAVPRRAPIPQHVRFVKSVLGDSRLRVPHKVQLLCTGVLWGPQLSEPFWTEITNILHACKTPTRPTEDEATTDNMNRARPVVKSWEKTTATTGPKETETTLAAVPRKENTVDNADQSSCLRHEVAETSDNKDTVDYALVHNVAVTAIKHIAGAMRKYKLKVRSSSGPDALLVRAQRMRRFWDLARLELFCPGTETALYYDCRFGKSGASKCTKPGDNVAESKVDTQLVGEPVAESEQIQNVRFRGICERSEEPVPKENTRSSSVGESDRCVCEPRLTKIQTSPNQSTVADIEKPGQVEQAKSLGGRVVGLPEISKDLEKKILKVPEQSISGGRESLGILDVFGRGWHQSTSLSQKEEGNRSQVSSDAVKYGSSVAPPEMQTETCETTRGMYEQTKAGEQGLATIGQSGTKDTETSLQSLDEDDVSAQKRRQGTEAVEHHQAQAVNSASQRTMETKVMKMTNDTKEEKDLKATEPHSEKDLEIGLQNQQSEEESAVDLEVKSPEKDLELETLKENFQPFLQQMAQDFEADLEQDLKTYQEGHWHEEDRAVYDTLQTNLEVEDLEKTLERNLRMENQAKSLEGNIQTDEDIDKNPEKNLRMENQEEELKNLQTGEKGLEVNPDPEHLQVDVEQNQHVENQETGLQNSSIETEDTEKSPAGENLVTNHPQTGSEEEHLQTREGDLGVEEVLNVDWSYDRLVRAVLHLKNWLSPELVLELLAGTARFCSIRQRNACLAVVTKNLLRISGCLPESSSPQYGSTLPKEEAEQRREEGRNPQEEEEEKREFLEKRGWQLVTYVQWVQGLNSTGPQHRPPSQPDPQQATSPPLHHPGQKTDTESDATARTEDENLDRAPENLPPPSQDDPQSSSRVPGGGVRGETVTRLRLEAVTLSFNPTVDKVVDGQFLEIRAKSPPHHHPGQRTDSESDATARTEAENLGKAPGKLLLPSQDSLQNSSKAPGRGLAEAEKLDSAHENLPPPSQDGPQSSSRAPGGGLWADAARRLLLEAVTLSFNPTVDREVDGQFLEVRARRIEDLLATVLDMAGHPPPRYSAASTVGVNPRYPLLAATLKLPSISTSSSSSTGEEEPEDYLGEENPTQNMAEVSSEEDDEEEVPPPLPAILLRDEEFFVPRGEPHVTAKTGKISTSSIEDVAKTRLDLVKEGERVPPVGADVTEEKITSAGKIGEEEEMTSDEPSCSTWEDGTTDEYSSLAKEDDDVTSEGSPTQAMEYFPKTWNVGDALIRRPFALIFPELCALTLTLPTCASLPSPAFRSQLTEVLRSFGHLRISLLVEVVCASVLLADNAYSKEQQHIITDVLTRYCQAAAEDAARTPQGGEDPARPQESAQPTTQGPRDLPPVSHKTLPASPGTCPCSLETCPEETLPASQEMLVPCEETLPASQEMLVPREETLPASQEMLLPCEETLPASQEMLVPREETLPASQEMLLPCEETLPASQEMLLPCEETLPASQEMLLPCEETLPASQEMLLPCEETLPASQEMLLPCKETLPASQEMLLTCEETLPASQEMLLPCEETLPASQEMLVPREETWPASQEMLCEETLPASQEMLLSCEETLPASQEVLLSAARDLSSSAEECFALQTANFLKWPSVVESACSASCVILGAQEDNIRMRQP